MQRRLLIIGAGGHGRSIAEAALLSGDWADIAFADDQYPDKTRSGSWPIIADSKHLNDILANFEGVVVALGNNRIRADKFKLLESLEAPFTSIIHPRAFVSSTASVGAGCTILANASVGANATLGKGCILNANSCADHDTELGEFSHLGVGVSLAGGVKIGEGVFMQVGTFAGYQSNIDPWVTLSAVRSLIKS